MNKMNAYFAPAVAVSGGGQSGDMSETYIFGMHWMHRRAMFYDEVSAASTDEAREYFNRHKRDDVALIRVELIGPGAAGAQGARQYGYSTAAAEPQ